MSQPLRAAAESRSAQRAAAGKSVATAQANAARGVLASFVDLHVTAKERARITAQEQLRLDSRLDQLTKEAELRASEVEQWCTQYDGFCREVQSLGNVEDLLCELRSELVSVRTEMVYVHEQLALRNLHSEPA